MRKILFYINTINHGGAERVVVNLANMFSKKDYEVILVTSFYGKEEYSLNDKVKRFSIENKELQQSFIKNNVKRIYKLGKICKSERPDIVISFMAEANFRAILATKLLGIKTLISVRNDPNREYPNIIYRFLAKVLYPLASGCVFQTEEAKRWFPKRIQKKSKIILNHVDEKFYKINYNGKRRDIVTVGRLEPQKNHKLLIKSFAQIANDFSTDNLVIYGDGSQRQMLIKLVADLGIEDRVIFMGVNKDIQERIKDAKIFVLSSDYEGLPNVVMEAMTLGLPVIATDCPCGGPRLLINNAKNGILIPVGNQKMMVKTMYKVLNNNKFRDELSQNAKERSLDFEPKKIFIEWEKYILKITN